MAKENWKCPYADCKRECSRHWNMGRHIDRKHAGLGKPVKEKTSEKNQARPDRIVKDNGYYPDKRPSKAFDEENDLIDTVYERVKEMRVKTDRIKEIKAFFSQDRAAIPPPNNVPVSLVDLPVGFKMYTCGDCLTSPIDPVKLSDFMRQGPDAFQPAHVCRQEDLEKRRRRVEKGVSLDFITTWDKLRSISIGFLANMLYQWFGPHKELSTNVVEVNKSTSRVGKLFPIELGSIGNDHWICRAFRNNESVGSTTIDENELKAFLNLARGTLALFHAKVKNQDKYFYAYILPKL